jgi:hypothetical protein
LRTAAEGAEGEENNQDEDEPPAGTEEGGEEDVVEEGQLDQNLKRKGKEEEGEEEEDIRSEGSSSGSADPGLSGTDNEDVMSSTMSGEEEGVEVQDENVMLDPGGMFCVVLH